LPPEASERRQAAEARAEQALAAYSSWHFAAFVWLFERALATDFHAVRLAKVHPPPASQDRLVIYTNHASWWDACIYLLLQHQLFPDRILRVPTDARMISKYRFMPKVGAFPVDLASRRGAVDFIAACRALLNDTRNFMIIAAQGRFVDVRERPLDLQPGLAHLPDIADDIIFVPLAIEYAFWLERQPEALLRFGPSMSAHDLKSLSVEDRRQIFEDSLAQQMDALAADSIARAEEAFTTLIAGRRGVNPLYDGWRRLRALVRGEPFVPEHGA
jgi:1-acyl-sn-glycerol-3-phosphate acyltransferase